MTVRTWIDGGAGGTPLSAARMNLMEHDIQAALTGWAMAPEAMFVGAVTRDTNQAALGASVVWPDGTPGTYTATTVSTAFPGAVDAYTVTYGSPPAATYTQPAVTRNGQGQIINRPQITVS